MNYNLKIKLDETILTPIETNLFIVFYGEKTTSKEINLTDYLKIDNLSKENYTIEFPITLDNLGKIFKLTLKNKGKASTSPLFLSTIEITCLENSVENEQEETYTFIFNKWIEADSFEILKPQNKHFPTYKYNVRETNYVSYTIKVPAQQKIIYEKELSKGTGFQFKNIITKKLTKEFNASFDSNLPYSTLLNLTQELQPVIISEEFLKTNFSESFNDSEFKENVKKEDNRLTLKVHQELYNPHNIEQIYRAIFTIKKADVIAKTNDIVSIFTVDTQLEFSGFILVE